MKVNEMMTCKVRTAAAQQSIRDAAASKARIDTVALRVPVVGLIGDRPIAIGATSVRQEMSGDIRYCVEDGDGRHPAESMAQIQLRRAPVLNRGQRPVGLVSLGSIARRGEQASATLLRGVAQAH